MAREAIVVPTMRGRRRSPVLFPDRFFPELSALGGETGGRQLFERHAGSIVEVEFASEAPFEDIDNREDLSRLESRHPASGSPEA